MCYIVLHCVTACCSVLQCVKVCYIVLHLVTVCSSVLQCVAVCYSVCSVLQCVARLTWCIIPVQCSAQCVCVGTMQVHLGSDRPDLEALLFPPIQSNPKLETRNSAFAIFTLYAVPSDKYKTTVEHSMFSALFFNVRL